MNRSVLLPCALVLLAACGCSQKVEVRSNVCWEGTVGSSFVDGCGNRTYSLKGDPKCATFSMKGDSGYVQVRIKGKDWVTTQQPYGSVHVCD
jgi:major membrane immunogen (membrane-anchored lipoprotein)